MGVEPFLVTASTNLIVAQRLGRKACHECAEPFAIEPRALMDAGMTEEQATTCQPVKGRGCTTCNNTGYKGRIAFYEVMPFNDELKDLVLQGCSTAELKTEAIRMGMKSLRMSGLSKVAENVTTLEEVVRVTAPD